MTTTQELLDATNTAILEIVQGAQAYTIRGRMAQKARLDHLTALRDKLISQVADETANSGAMASVGQVHAPR